MYLNSKSYEQKYKKYKSRYKVLKKQLSNVKGILSGGECLSLPNPEEEEDLLTIQNLLDLCPGERITIQNKCYEVKGLHK